MQLELLVPRVQRGLLVLRALLFRLMAVRAVLGTTANFNDSTPAAGSGNQNAKWQVTSTTISAEVPQPQYLGAVDAIGAAGSAQTIACPSNGVASMSLSANLTITITQPSGNTCLVRLRSLPKRLAVGIR